MRNRKTFLFLTGAVLLSAWGLAWHPASAATIRVAGGRWFSNSEIVASNLVIESEAALSGTGTIHAATTVRGTVSPGESLTDIGSLAFDGDLTFDNGRFLCYAAASDSLDQLSATGRVSGISTVAITRAGGVLPSEQVIIEGAGSSDYSSFDVSPSDGWHLGQVGSLDLWISAVPVPRVLGTNGAVIASGEIASQSKGTVFPPMVLGASANNSFAITNDGLATLTISQSDLSDPINYSVAGMPASIPAGSISNFTVTYAPATVGTHPCTLVISNNSPTDPYTVNLAGSCFALSTNVGPYAGDNSITITNGTLGDGSDITNVLVDGVSAAITGQGVNWVTIILPPASAAGSVDVLVQSVSEGDTLLTNAYTYNPAGSIGGTTYDWSQWEIMPGLPQARYYLGGDVLNNNLYVVGGSDSGNTPVTNVYMFDGTSWMEVAGLPQALRETAVATYDGALYSIGGYTGASRVTNVYKFNGSTWSEVAGLPASRFSMGAAVLGGNLIAYGGRDSGGALTNVYSFDGSSWTEITGMSPGKFSMGYGAYSGKVYSVAGYTFTSATYEFDGSSWQAVANLPISAAMVGVAPLGGYLYAVGGQEFMGDATNVYRFDGTSWSGLPGVPVAESAMAACAYDGSVYAIGGHSGSTTLTNVHRYPAQTTSGGVSPASGSWTGGYQVVIGGVNLGNGSDITNVTLCGFDVSSIVSQQDTQVTVIASSTGGAFLGDVVVYSTSFGMTTKSNAFTYLAPQMIALGTNGAWLASEDPPDSANGTLYRPTLLGQALTNSFGITNSGNMVLTITDWTTNGTGAGEFQVVDMPLTVDAGTVSNFSLIYNPNAVGTHTATVEIASTDVYTPYLLNFGGTCFTASTNNGPYAGGNSITLTNGILGDGSDITNVLVDGVSAAITDQGVNWVTITLPTASSAGSVDVLVQSLSEGDTILRDAYTYNPPGSIGAKDWSQWEEIASIPMGQLLIPACTVLSNTLYCVGGYDGTFSPATNVYTFDGSSWTEIAGLPNQVGAGAAAVLGGSVYALGGNDGVTTLSNVWTFNGSSWTAGDNIPIELKDHVAATLDGSIYVFGGAQGAAGTVTHTNFLKYDGASWSWAGTENSAIYDSTAVVYGNLIYLLGGSGEGSYTNCYEYNGIATSLTEVPGSDDQYAKWISGVLNGQMYVAAGSTPGGPTTNVFSFDGTAWTAVPGLPEARQYAAGGVIDGVMYVAGGIDGAMSVKTNVYRYPSIGPGVTPATGSWTGGFQVVINGEYLGNGSDVTNVTLAGVRVTSIDGQSSTQIVVTADASLAVSGDVIVQSVSYGTTIKPNAFTYLEPRIMVLGTNGAAVASGDAANSANGTDFGDLIVGMGSLTNTFSITNSGNGTLTISGVTTSGTGATSFTLESWPASVAVGAVEDFSVIFLPDGGGAKAAALTFANDSTNGTYEINLAGYGSGGGIALETNILEYTATYVGSNPADQYLLMNNVGVSSFTYTNLHAYSGWASNWLTILPGTGTVAMGGSTTLTNMIDITGINAGNYTCTVQITAIDATNSPQSVRVTLVVTPADQTITFPTPGAQETTNHVGLAATATSGLTVSFNVDSGPGAISDDTNLTFSGAGDVVLTASQAGNSNWNAAVSVTHTIAVTKAVANVILGDLSQVYNGTARTVTSSTDPIGLTVNLTYDGNTWAPTNAGNYAITGVVSDIMYQGVKTGTLSVAKADQTITFTNNPTQTYTSLVELAATATSGFGVSFAVGSGPATISEGTNLGFTATGTVSVVASQGGNANWNAAPAVTNTFMVGKANQAITFPVILDQITTNTTPISATAVSGLDVTFSVVAGPAVLTNATSPTSLTFTNDGTVLIAAHQPGSNYWYAAPSVTNTFNVTKAIGTVTLSDLTQVYDGTEKYPTDQTDPSNLVVNLTFDGFTNLPVNVGTYEVIGTMNDPMYQDAATNTFTIVQATQTISFAQIPDQVITGLVGLAASGGDSTNGVTFSVLSGPAAIAGATNLSFSNVGEIQIIANQAGDSNYQAAITVTNIFNVSPVQPAIDSPTASNILSKTASLGATITTTNGAPVTERGVYWHVDGSSNVFQALETGAFGTGAFSLDVTGIVAGVTNYYEAYAENVSGRVYTAESSFLARSDAPEMLPAPATNTYDFTALWNSAIGATNYLMDVATDSGFASILPAYDARVLGNITTLSVTGLTEGTTYFYRLRSENAQGIGTNSATMQITTYTEGAIGLTPTEFTFNAVYSGTNPAMQTCTVTNFGETAYVFTNEITYGGPITGWLTTLPFTETLGVHGTLVMTSSVDIATLNAGTYYATNAVTSPTATNSPQTVRATLVVDLASQSITFPSIPDQVITGLVGLAASGGASTNPVTFSVLSGPASIAGDTNLSFNNVGEVQIIANQAGDSNYYPAVTVTNIFNVSPVQPAIDTPTVSNILSKTASLGATITSTNGAPVTQRGVLWRVDGSTNVYMSIELGSFGTGAFSMNVTGIIAGVTNYYQAFARNVSGTVYTAESSFLARPDAPELTGATNIQATAFYANWNAAIGATNYYIDVSETNDFSSFVPGYNDLMLGDVSSVNVTGLGAVVYYYYRVRSENDTGISTNSGIWEVGLMMDLIINALPTEHDTPAPLGYGTNRVIVNTMVTNTVTTPAEESNGVRYACTGWSGTGDVPATGTANTVTFLFTVDSTLTWHWKTQYELTQTASGGTIEGLTDGWKDEGWIFDLYPIANNGYVFTRWRTNGVNAGTTKLLTIVADSPVDVQAVFTATSWDVDTQGTVSMTGYRLDPGSGLFYCTFRVCNPSASGVTLRDRFLYAMDPNAMTFLNDPDGTSPTGKEYKDVTAEVKSKLQSIGNGDQIMDPGECVTLNEIAFWARDPNDITSYFYSRGAPIMTDRDTDGDGIPNDWEEQEGLNKNNPTDGGEDQDDDGVPSEEEYLADTNPFDANSFLHIYSITPDLISGEEIGWIGGTSVVQDLEWAPTMTGTWVRIRRFNPPTPSTNDWYNDPAQSPGFYRIKAVR